MDKSDKIIIRKLAFSIFATFALKIDDQTKYASELFSVEIYAIFQKKKNINSKNGQKLTYPVVQSLPLNFRSFYEISHRQKSHFFHYKVAKIVHSSHHVETK